MTNNKQQTAVEWLWEIAYNRELTVEDWKQAKEVEKERLEKTWIEALDYGINNLKGLNNLSSKEAFDKYYEQTYGGGNNEQQ